MIHVNDNVIIRMHYIMLLEIEFGYASAPLIA